MYLPQLLFSLTDFLLIHFLIFKIRVLAVRFLLGYLVTLIPSCLSMGYLQDPWLDGTHVGYTTRRI